MNPDHTVHRAIAVRAYVPPTRPRHRKPPLGSPEYVLVLDTETETDAAQAFLFGSYRLYRADGRLVQEGLIHADDLGGPRMEILRAYCAAHAADNAGRLRLLSRSEFVHWLIWKMGYEARAPIVGFNLPFDLSRLSVGWRPARNGGFTLRLFESVDANGRRWKHQYRPEITIKALDSKRQLLNFTTPARLDPENQVEGQGYRGRFLDLRTLAYTLSDRSYTLDGAAEAWEVGERKLTFEAHGEISVAAIDYNRQDVRTTYALCRALVADWAHHPVELDPEQGFSAAGLAKAYFRAFGITPPMSRGEAMMERELGAASTAYFGGRSESRIRGVPLPVRYVDYTSMYPTVFALQGLWRWVIAERFEVRPVTVEARRMLRQLDREALHVPGAWPQLAMVFCRVRPDGELLPTRARYADDAGAWTIGINHLHSHIDLWFTLADLLAAKLLGGTAPEILEAIRIEPVGVLPGLHPLKLRGSVPADPTEDLFRLAIEERKRLRGATAERDGAFLKTFANGGAYGVFAEYLLLEPKAGGVPVKAHGLWPISTRVHTPEEPGEYSFPPLAATVTGAARLLLALLQADIEARGGTYVACDTDSLIVVVSRDGGLVACPGGPYRLPDGREAVMALSWAELDEVLAGINALNPYRDGTVPSLVKLEQENFAADRSGVPVDLRALAVSPKRYVLYELTPDGPVIRKPSEHGLGMYRQPIDNPPGRNKKWRFWVEHVWQTIIRETEGLPPPRTPPWYERPALSQLSVTTPRQLAPFRSFNQHRRFRDQVKPFGFMLVGHVDPLMPLPDELTPGEVAPVAPYTTKPEEFLDLPWVDRNSTHPIAVTTRPGGEPRKVRLKTYGDVIAEYRMHPDVKSGDPDGSQAHRGSRGLLPRLHVLVTEVRHIGKESNHFDEEEEGSVLQLDEVYVEYRDERQEWLAALPQLRAFREAHGWRVMADASGLSERAVRDALNKGRMPHPKARAALTRLSLNATPRLTRNG
jgi:hypothetical protein